MSELQVLVAAMGQKDFSLTDKMNLRCDSIIANQTDRNEVQRMEAPWGKVEMISTTTGGVGKNRNIALIAADAELLLFADDDVCYYDGTLKGVKDAFRQLPQADMIVFGVDILRDGQITEKRHLKTRRLHIWNAMKYGTYALAVRRSALMKANIWFHTGFGGGCIYGSGEDSLLIRQCLQKGLKIYSHSYVLGTCCKDVSSWFTGYHEKYFFDKGAMLSVGFPRSKRLMAMYFSVRFKKKTTVSMTGRFRMMLRGMKAARTMTSYAQYAKSREQ